MIDRSLNYGRHHIRRFLEASGEYAAVLDVGAGRGTDLQLARAVRPSADLHAIEVYEPYARELREMGVTVHALDLERERLPFEDGGLDVVIANQILEHVKEVFWIFHELSRTLRTGGSLILGVPNLASLHNRLLLLAGLQPTTIQNVTAHVRGYTKRDILRLLETVFPGGYRLAGFGGSNFYPFPPAVARPLARLAPSLAWGIFLKLEKRREYAGEFLRYPRQAQLETNFYVGGRERQ